MTAVRFWRNGLGEVGHNQRASQMVLTDKVKIFDTVCT